MLRAYAMFAPPFFRQQKKTHQTLPHPGRLSNAPSTRASIKPVCRAQLSIVRQDDLNRWRIIWWTISYARWSPCQEEKRWWVCLHREPGVSCPSRCKDHKGQGGHDGRRAVGTSVRDEILYCRTKFVQTRFSAYTIPLDLRLMCDVSVLPLIRRPKMTFGELLAILRP